MGGKGRIGGKEEKKRRYGEEKGRGDTGRSREESRICALSSRCMKIPPTRRKHNHIQTQ